MMKTSDLIDLAPYALIQLDHRRRVTAVNAEAQHLFSQSKRSMLRQPLSEILYHDSPIFELIDRCLLSRRDVSAHGISVNGPVLSSGRLVNLKLRPDSEGGIVIALIEDTSPIGLEPTSNVSAFGRILGHEVKNPLAGISGAAQLLARNARGDQIGMLNIIKSETKRIERLISRLTAFELFSAPRFEPFNIHRILDQVVASEEVATGRSLAVTRLYDPSLPDIEADKDHLHEAFQNIVRNASEAAMSYSDAPRVVVSTSYETGFKFVYGRSSKPASGALRVSIKDNGPGISDEAKGRIFDLFKSSKSGSRGIGLNIVQEIVSAHNGRIRIDSKPGDTCISVILPLAKRMT